jgi:hypothetical protein
MRLFPWSRWWRRSPTRSPERARPRFRPRLEGLETRQLPSTYTVNALTDTGTGSGFSGDLRYCIAKADADTTSTSNTIKFSQSVFGNPQTITLSSALVIDPAVPLTIKGPNSDTVTLSGGNAHQVLDIRGDAGGTVTISDLDITQGFSFGAFGGGISNSGTLTLINCTLDHDSASDGGIGGSGGGLANLGTATVTNCTFNLDSAGGGGGIASFGTLTLSGTNISNCTSPFEGGGLWVSGGGGKDMVRNCTFSNDSCTGDGGAVFVEDSIGITFTGCTLSNGSAGNGGGGLLNDGAVVTMNNCTISNDHGSGVVNVGGTVALTDCTLANDTANIVDAASGGGMINQGTATLTGCTFSNDVGVSAGGLYNAGPATMTKVTNCTFSNNEAIGNGASGGGIYNTQGATLTLTNCTVAYNSAAANGIGGGIDNVAGSTLNLFNTIVAENTAGSSPDVAGTINTADHNLIGDGTGSKIVTDEGGNQIGGINGAAVIDPRLGPLADNGGPTQTIALLRGSPAIGMADDNALISAGVTTDQRGHARTDHFGLATDIGAYEYP